MTEHTGQAYVLSLRMEYMVDAAGALRDTCASAEEATKTLVAAEWPDAAQQAAFAAAKAAETADIICREARRVAAKAAEAAEAADREGAEDAAIAQKYAVAAGDALSAALKAAEGADYWAEEAAKAAKTIVCEDIDHD